MVSLPSIRRHHLFSLNTGMNSPLEILDISVEKQWQSYQAYSKNIIAECAIKRIAKILKYI